jgi:hypothetical protein
VFLTAVTGINNAGQIVAYGEDPLAFMHGVVYTNGVPVDLGNNTQAFAINSSGDVVGIKLGNSAIGLYGVIDNDESPFVYSNGIKSDLNLPGAIPAGINDSGRIIANHLTLNHAYVLQPSSIRLAPFGLSFGSTVLGQSNSGTAYACGSCLVTLTNDSASPVSVTGVAIVGPFSQTNACGASLSPAASCVITVSFAPKALGTALGALTVGVAGAQYATLLNGTATIEAQISSSTTAATVNVPFTLTWTASAGSMCVAAGDTQFSGPVAVSGSKAITEPAAKTVTFALSCTQGSLSAQAQLIVTVSTPSSHGGGGALDLASAGALLMLWGLRRLRR